jgi:serine/threonine-protein kinase 24/25/MST4
MTPKGVVVVEQEDLDDTPPASPASPPASPSRTRGASSSNLSTGSGGRDDAKKSPISELLYMRWLDGLKMKWPSLL